MLQSDDDRVIKLADDLAEKAFHVVEVGKFSLPFSSSAEQVWEAIVPFCDCPQGCELVWVCTLTWRELW